MERGDLGFSFLGVAAVQSFGAVVYLVVCGHCRCGGSCLPGDDCVLGWGIIDPANDSVI